MSELASNYTAAAAIPKHRIVKHGATDREVALAAAATDACIGVSHEISADKGERLDVWHVGIVLVEAGAAIARGAPVASDSTGRGITAAPGTGVNARVVGFALEAAGAAGDLVRVLLAPCVMRG